MWLLISLAVIVFLSLSALLWFCQRLSSCFAFHTGHIALKVFVQIKLHLCRWCFHVWVSKDRTNDSTKWLLWWQLYCAEKRRLPGSMWGSSDISQYSCNIYIEVRDVEMGLTLCMFCWCRVVDVSAGYRISYLTSEKIQEFWQTKYAGENKKSKAPNWLGGVDGCSA